MSMSLLKFSLPNSEEIKVIQEYVKYAATTGHYKKLIASGGEGAIFLILLMAREYDIPPLAALNGGLAIIDGKIEMASHMKVSKIRQAGHSLSIAYNDNHTECVIKGKRRDTGDEATISYSLEDARKAGLDKRMNWQKYPKEMLYARAVSRICNILFSDAIGGITYAPGEIQEISEADVEVRSAKEIPFKDPDPLKDMSLEAIEAGIFIHFPVEKHSELATYIDMVQSKSNVSGRQVLEMMYLDIKRTTAGFDRWYAEEEAKMRDNDILQEEA